MEARQFALRCIAPYVLRGDSLSSLRDSWFGYSGSEGRMQIGGYVQKTKRVPGRLTIERVAVLLTTRKLAVTRLDGEECLHVFELETLYRELRHGSEQGSLF